MSNYNTCKRCHGYKKIISSMGGIELKCPDCDGQGFVAKPIDLISTVTETINSGFDLKKLSKKEKKRRSYIMKDHLINGLDNVLDSVLTE